MTVTRAIRGSIGAGLAVFSLLTMASRSGATLIPGGPANKASSDCYLELDVDFEPGSATVQGSTVICTDGDACDTGPCGDSACTLRVAACINQSDPNLPGCTPPAGLDSAKIKGKFTVNVPQALTGSVCGGFLDATVPAQVNKKNKYLKGKSRLKLKGKATAPKGTKPRTDSDTWILQCAPRTTECPSSTTVTTTSTTTSTTSACTNAMALDFTSGIGNGACGDIRDGSDNVIRNLQCGGLNIGGGSSVVREGGTPDGATNRFLVGNCVSGQCDVCLSPQAGNGFDCTDTGCRFGTPLPVQNGVLSTCVLNTFAAPASGHFDLTTGSTSDLSVSLDSFISLTGNVYGAAVCPVCADATGKAVSGSPAAPATGRCKGGKNDTAACATTNSSGYTWDCLPGKEPCTAASCADQTVNLGSIGVNLTPLKTESVSLADAAGLMCATVGQGNGQKGCFGSSLCTKIAETGVPAGPLTLDTPATITLGTVFCIPGTSSAVVNGSANLPGPGATSLVGTMTLRNLP